MNPGSATINWGDGITDDIGNPTAIRQASHKYSDSFISEYKNKIFYITIDGDIKKLSSSNQTGSISPSSLRTGLKSLIVGVSPLCKRQTTAECLFEYIPNLKTVPSDLFSYCKINNFYGCFRFSGLTSVPKNLFDSA